MLFDGVAIELIFSYGWLKWADFTRKEITFLVLNEECEDKALNMTELDAESSVTTAQ